MKPSTRIEEIEEELKKQYAPLGNSGEYTTAQEIRINSRAIIQYIDEQAESQEPKALEGCGHAPKWTGLCANCLRIMLEEKDTKPNEEYQFVKEENYTPTHQATRLFESNGKLAGLFIKSQE